MDHDKTFVQSIIDRMKAVLGFSKDKELSEYLGGSRSTTAAWKLRGTIPINECIALATEHGVSLDWLILGRGSAPSPELIQGENGASVLEQALYIDVPVFDMSPFAPAGEAVSHWTLPRAWLEAEGLTIEDTFIIRAVGDLMAETIVDGQMVLIDRRPRDTDGVFLVRFGDQPRFKRVQRMVDGSVRLSYDNPAYAVDTIPSKQDGEIEIIGYCHSMVSHVR